MMRAVLMISHGSRYPKTIEEIRKTLQDISEEVDVSVMEYAFLELQSPDIPEGIDQCVKKGADEILVLLNFLNAGRHVDLDIPEIISESRKKYPHVRIIMSKPLGHHPGIVGLFADIIRNS